MYQFFYKFVNLALPSIRDFRGVSRKLDGNGNYTFGVTDHTIFPEINVDGNKRSFGFDLTIVTSAKTDAEASTFFHVSAFRSARSAQINPKKQLNFSLAKKSAIARNKKRIKMVEQYAQKRADLKAIIANPVRLTRSSSQHSASSPLPRNSSVVCATVAPSLDVHALTSVSSAYLVSLSANSPAKAAFPGVTKSSW